MHKLVLIIQILGNYITFQLQLYTAKSQYWLHKAQAMNIDNLSLITFIYEYLHENIT